jgi:hypothetical protein
MFNFDNKNIRILANVLVFFSIVWGYWWMTWIISLSLIFIFPKYYEIMFWSIMYDSIYGASLQMFYNTPFVFTILSIILLIVSIIFRKNLLAYET